MWRSYALTAWRFLVADRLFTFVNLLGLAVGLASVILISLQVAAGLTADRNLPDHERLFRIDTLETTSGSEPVDIARAPGPLRSALLSNFPGDIEDIARAFPVTASVLRSGEPQRAEILAADSNFLAVLGLPLRHGTATRALADAYSIAISERAARLYFGTPDAVGRRLTILAPGPRDFTVSAVFETLPANSHMDFDLVIPTAGYFPTAGEEIAAIPDSWAGSYFFTYARLREGADPAAIERHLPALVDRSLPDWLTGLLSGAPHDFYRFRFVPIADVAFDGGATAGFKPKASRSALWVLSGVALLILAIAMVNFANLTTARSTLRAREVAIRKVCGAASRQIFVQFMAEAILLTALAGLAGLALVELSYPWLAGFLGMPETLGPGGGWRVWSGVALGVLATAIVSGLYPSLVLARLRPARIIAGIAAFRAGRIGQALVVAQFAVAIALIAATLVMLAQVRFAARSELGFDAANLLVLQVPDAPGADETARALRDRLARAPGVAGLSLSSSVPSDESEDNLSVERPNEARPVQLGFHRVDPAFFATYRVALLGGRIAEPAPDGAPAARVLINEAASRRLGYARPQQAAGAVLQTSGRELHVAGIVPNLRFRSLHDPVREEVYILDDTPGRRLSIRYRPGDLSRLQAAVAGQWRDFFPGQQLDQAFLHDRLEALYAGERRQVRLLTLFAGLAVLLSCLGLVAMSAFAAQRRAREIALRKVLGARTRDIVPLLAWQFSRPVILANLIAWPIAWWAMREWLNRFDLRIDLGPAPFIVAGLLALTVALGTVAGHALRIARTSPIEALRHE